MSVDERVAGALRRAAAGAAPAPAPAKGKPGAAGHRGPCRSLGLADGETVDCPTCRGAVALKTFHCSIHGKCTPSNRAPGVACCSTCADWVAAGPAWDRLAPLRLDRPDLDPDVPGYRFNGSLARRGDGYVFVCRDGWAGSDVWAWRLDAGFRPTGRGRRLDLTHWAAGYGREDPQLFEYGGRLFVAFVGVQGAEGRVLRTNVLFAELRDDLTAGPVYAPRAPGVDPRRWEKNWGFFESDGALYAVYSIAPHRVLRVRGNSAEWAAGPLPNRLPWGGGERRGGAPPVRVGDELWTFFHDRVDRPGRKPLYRMGLIANDAAFPFLPRRHVPGPILAADPNTNPNNYCDCLFPRGAVRVGPDWVVASGEHDRWTALHAFPHADLERRLVGV